MREIGRHAELVDIRLSMLQTATRKGKTRVANLAKLVRKVQGKSNVLLQNKKVNSFPNRTPQHFSYRKLYFYAI